MKTKTMKETKGITLIALVITIVLNSSSLAMERKGEKDTRIEKIEDSEYNIIM